MFGFLNVYKPRGMTSHDVVAAIRRATQIRQVGHTGTLDPFAEGVLPICIGKATRLIEYLPDDKAYIGTVQLGSSTSTYDVEGETVKTSDKKVGERDIAAALNYFKGDIEQFPPIYSAIKVKGKKLYEYARNGEEVKIEPRRVNVSEIRIENYDDESHQLKLYIACSKGTYIRSIANDLGERLGTYGHLIELKRVKAGSFFIKASIKLEILNTKEAVESNLINPLSSLDYPKYELTQEEYEKVLHGMPFDSREEINNPTILLIYNNTLAAVAEDGHNNIIKCKKVFV